jgi:hypothetical protein
MAKALRFVVFAWEPYGPAGAWGDHDSSYDTLDEAIAVAELLRGWKGRTQIIDLETGDDVTPRGLAEGLPLEPYTSLGTTRSASPITGLTDVATSFGGGAGRADERHSGHHIPAQSGFARQKEAM